MRAPSAECFIGQRVMRAAGRDPGLQPVSGAMLTALCLYTCTRELSIHTEISEEERFADFRSGPDGKKSDRERVGARNKRGKTLDE